MEGSELFIPLRHSPWLAIRDFNTILFSNDKKSSNVRGQKCSLFFLFGDFVDKGKLYDMGFKGPHFTWHQGKLFEKLDQALGNKAWVETFPNCFITHLLRIKSDHWPLLLKLQSEPSFKKGRLFLFLERWLQHLNFLEFVRDN